jgi:hypothetical protein
LMEFFQFFFLLRRKQSLPTVWPQVSGYQEISFNKLASCESTGSPIQLWIFQQQDQNDEQDGEESNRFRWRSFETKWELNALCRQNHVGVTACHDFIPQLHHMPMLVQAHWYSQSPNYVRNHMNPSGDWHHFANILCNRLYPSSSCVSLLGNTQYSSRSNKHPVMDSCPTPLSYCHRTNTAAWLRGTSEPMIWAEL